MGMCSNVTRCQGGVACLRPTTLPFSLSRPQQKPQPSAQHHAWQPRGSAVQPHAFSGGVDDLGVLQSSERRQHVMTKKEIGFGAHEQQGAVLVCGG
jgi:hypothetical protein